MENIEANFGGYENHATWQLAHWIEENPSLYESWLDRAFGAVYDVLDGDSMLHDNSAQISLKATAILFLELSEWLEEINTHEIVEQWLNKVMQEAIKSWKIDNAHRHQDD